MLRLRAAHGSGVLSLSESIPAFYIMVYNGEDVTMRQTLRVGRYVDDQ